MSYPPRDSVTGPPRWVKVSAIIVAAVVLLLVLLMVLSGGRHGPGRHLRHGDPDVRAPSEPAPR